MATQGRSVYLTNKQWFALSDFIDDDRLSNYEASGCDPELVKALKKLQGIADEIVATRKEN